MKRGQFTFYRSYYEALKSLKKSDREAVFMAICSYTFEEAEPELSGVPLAIFTLIKPTLDASKRKAESGSAGGNCKNNEEANWKQTGSKREANGKQTGSKPEANNKQTGSKQQANGKQTTSEKEGEKEKEKEYECTPPISPSRGNTDPFSVFASGDSELLSALRDFEGMRKKIKKPMTDRAKEQLLLQLDKLGKTRAEKISLLNEAVLHCWQTVYAHDDGREDRGKAEHPEHDPKEKFGGWEPENAIGGDGV